MKTKAVYYIGSFPPPFGGVTNKNELLFKELSQYYWVRRSRGNNRISQVKNILAGICFGSKFIIGAGSNKKLIKLTETLSKLCPKKMSKSIVMVMGGSFSNILNKKNVADFKKYKKIYVETSLMKEELNILGLFNVDVYPNCRKKPDKEYYVKRDIDCLKCVFFSRISIDKGADLILDAAKIIPNIKIDFFGEIDKEYEKNFLEAVSLNDNTEYKGIYNVFEDSVYEKLNEYDLLLFPTKWKHEGVPGILIEAKIAAITAIVSDFAYNRYIIHDKVDGIVLDENSPERLAEEIIKLSIDKQNLINLKSASKKDGERYYVDNYINEIVKILR